MSRREKKRFRVRISALEADVAYFDARLALLSSPPSSRYQEAQIRTYRELSGILSGMLERLQGLQSKEGNGIVVAVEELTDGQASSS